MDSAEESALTADNERMEERDGGPDMKEVIHQLRQEEMAGGGALPRDRPPAEYIMVDHIAVVAPSLAGFTK